MDPRAVFQMLLGIVGLALASYGLHLLLTGRMSPFVQRRWRRPVDAGIFFLCSGLFLLSVAVAYFGRLIDVIGSATAFSLVDVALVLWVFALVRYRPRDNGRGGSSDVA